MRQSKGLLAAAGAKANAEEIVTDDLILYYNAGITESYPGIGTTWTDLVSNTTATLEPGTSYSSNNGGEILFDSAIGGYAQVATDANFTVSGATFIIWVLLNDLDQDYSTGLFFGRYGVATGLNLLGRYDVGNTTNVGYHWNDDSSTYAFDSGLTIPAQEMCMVAVSVQTDFADLYLCRSSGTTSARNTTNHASVTLGNLEIGRDSSEKTGRRYLDGSIPIAQLYNRALSSTEIEQNFQAFKERFGL